MCGSPAALREPQGETRPLVGEASAKAGHRRQTPRSLPACSLLPHKGQKGTWEETGPLGEAGGRSGLVSCAPRAMKQLLPQSPIKAQGRCAERAGASRGERGEVPLPVVSPDL